MQENFFRSNDFTKWIVVTTHPSFFGGEKLKFDDQVKAQQGNIVGFLHCEKLFMGYPYFGSFIPPIGIQIPNKFNSKAGVYDFVAIY